MKFLIKYKSLIEFDTLMLNLIDLEWISNLPYEFVLSFMLDYMREENNAQSIIICYERSATCRFHLPISRPFNMPMNASGSYCRGRDEMVVLLYSASLVPIPQLLPCLTLDADTSVS